VDRTGLIGRSGEMVAAGMLESGSVQFIIFGVMILAIFITLLITIAK
jgi:hypothetical protein